MRAHNSYFRRKNSKKGLALSTTMAICIVLAILVALLVSMASLNINTTQVTIDQRSSYVQAKSAIAFAESYYAQYPNNVPGGTSNTGEGLIVFKSSNIADGAVFYETRKGLNETMSETEIRDLKENCPDTYIEVTNGKTAKGVKKLTLNAFSKYDSKDSNAYTLAKEYVLGGMSDTETNAFTGSINYQTTNFTRYVRFHVHATTAFNSSPYFYMWYNQISPAADSGKGGVYNAYAESSIVNKLTWNDKYSKVQNGSWDSSGPAGDCAMSYEGNGWWVTQKTFNLDRNLHFVNGIITRANSVRSAGDDQQSWEFFGIPIPEEDELGAANGVDIYFEVNQDRLLDMKGQKSDGHDDFTKKFEEMPKANDAGKTQLDNFVKFCSEWYTVYTKTDTAIIHYRATGETDQYKTNDEGKYVDGSGNVTTDPNAYVSTGIQGFAYEGYGWWRDWSHNFGDSISVGGATYSYGSGKIVSQNQYGREVLRELYVCYDEKTNSSAAFEEEEEANEWFVKHGDLSAGDYVEVNVKAIGQPVDENDAPETTIQYSAEIFKDDVKVPSIDEDKFKAISGKNVLSSDTDTDVEPTAFNEDELEFQKLATNWYGSFYLVGTMNNWQENKSWNQLKDQLRDSGSNKYTIEYDVAPNKEVKFLIVQKPKNLRWYYEDNDWNQYNMDSTYRLYDSMPSYDIYNNGFYYTNYWGTGSPDDGYKTSFVPTTNKIRITFTSSQSGESIDVEDIGEIVQQKNAYSVVGWMNSWGTKQDGVESVTARYELTRDMEMYADVDNIMTYSDNTLTILTGQQLYFKIAERDAEVTEGDIDWSKVIGRVWDDSRGWIPKITEGIGQDDAAVLIEAPPVDDGKIHKYLITITLKELEDGSMLPDFELVETSNVDTFYVAGEFNGWAPEEAADYKFADLRDFEMEEQGADINDIVYSYKLDSLQEAGTYTIRVIGSSALTSDGGVNYASSWGDKKSTVQGEEGYLVTQGEDTPSMTYKLTDRAYVTINFTYHKNDPTKSEITVAYTTPNSSVKRVYVGFHNDKLINVNDHSKDSRFEHPWENVYVTYYTKETGFNCFDAYRDGDTADWWAEIPEDAEYCYFSNKKTSIYKQLHSEDFEYTDNISSSKFKGSESTIFFPIIPVEDSEKRTRWTVGDSQDYNTYVNERKMISHRTETMAYYGSTQCNYYDAPIVNVLNMLVSGSSSPSTKYAFSFYPFSKYSVAGHNLSFNANTYVSYQGEKYYYTTQSANPLSFLIVQNAKSTGGGKNHGSMGGYMFEGDMSLKENGGSWQTQVWDDYYTTKEIDNGSKRIYTSNIGGSLYCWDRAGGVFVSDTNYRNGDPSLFNYNGYTPSWYTFRIPVTSSVTIEYIRGVVDSSTKVVDNNTTPFEVVKEDLNLNRDIYIYKPGSGATQAYSYNIDRGVVDADAETNKIYVGSTEVYKLTGKVTVSAYFANTEGWNNVYVRAYSPIGEDAYTQISKDTKSDDSGSKDYYVFSFDQGKYSFFQFYEAPDKDADGNAISNKASKEALAAAEHKSSVLYFTGEEFGTSEDKYDDTYDGIDSRTTKILAVGSAEGFTWYMHPKTKVMHAYLDLDSVVQLTKIPKRYLYSREQGTYTYFTNEILEMSALKSEKNKLKNKYYSSGPWSSDSIGDYSGLLEAATNFMNAVSEARIYCSDDVREAKTDAQIADSNRDSAERRAARNRFYNYNSEGSAYWMGNDSSQMMVYMEGEQIQNGIFEYTSRWTSGLKELLKRYTLSSGAEYVWGDNKSRQTAGALNQYAANLRLWLDNPQATIKPTAVTITVDDARKNGLGGWGKEGIRLYVKNKDTNEWSQYTSEILTTTQANYYAFAFDFPNESDPSAPDYNMYNGCEFTIIPSNKTIDENNMVDGITVKTLKLYAGGRFRYNTWRPIGSDESFDEDNSKETKTYDGTEIRDGDNSPTAKLNVWTGMKIGREFILYFKYDTVVSGGGVSYKIYAGSYEISENTYEGFYKDLGANNATEAEQLNTGSGIDLFTRRAKDFFTNPSTYGMHSAKDYTEWRTNKDNSTKDVDLMTSAITKNGSISASANKSTVSFRYNGAKGSDTLKVDRGISLQGNKIVVAANTLDFRNSGSNDFTLRAKTIEFKTDTLVRTSSGNATINHGTYVFNAKNDSEKVITASLKSTRADGNDWRSRYVLMADEGSKVGGGKFVAK